ncbi:hypothetical protein EDB89DRAFT_1912724 [Lactarius sanguifluus]|nr:hypothetical protein EDB89DRAFT_1912724 [Lactarius sanguifluus]
MTNSDRHDRHCGPCADSGIKFPHKHNDIMASQQLTIYNNDTLHTEMQPTRGHMRTQANTRRGNSQKSAMTPMTPHANSTQVNANTDGNRYALLDPDATCDDVSATVTTHGWTTVTHKRKQMPGKDETATLLRFNPPKGSPQSRCRTTNKAEAHVAESTCGDAHSEVEAHVANPTCGDTESSPLPSPEPRVTPLTRHLNVQSDALGVDHARAIRIQELRRWAQEATIGAVQAGVEPEPERVQVATSMIDETAQIEEAHPTTPANETMVFREETPGEHNTIDPLARAEQYASMLGPLTDEERHDAISQYLMKGRWTCEDKEDALDKPTSTEVDIGRCESTEESRPLRWETTNLNPHDTMRACRTERKRKFLSATGRTAEDDISHHPRKSSINREEATTPSKDTIAQMIKAGLADHKRPGGGRLTPDDSTEEDPIVAIDTLTDKE